MEITASQYMTLCNLFESAWHHTVPGTLEDVLPFTSTEARQLSNLAVEALGLEHANG